MSTHTWTVTKVEPKILVLLCILDVQVHVVCTVTVVGHVIAIAHQPCAHTPPHEAHIIKGVALPWHVAGVGCGATH